MKEVRCNNGHTFTPTETDIKYDSAFFTTCLECFGMVYIDPDLLSEEMKTQLRKLYVDRLESNGDNKLQWHTSKKRPFGPL